MQIVTIEDREFPSVLMALKDGKPMGRYTAKNGQVLVVYAAPSFMFVSTEADQTKIAMRPAVNEREAVELALRYLHREKERGHQVEVAQPYLQNES